jgi:CheY-like chemotaxis protein
MKKRGHLHVTIAPEVLEAARAKRKATGQSMSHVVEMALRRWIAEESVETVLKKEEAIEQHHRVLLVDDDPLFVKVTQLVLNSAGYDVMTAKGGSEALGLMRRHRPDLVVLDIMMDSILDGLHVSRSMWEDADLRKIPVVMVSAIASSPHLFRFPQDEYLNAVDFLFKPVQPSELLESVNRILK